MTTIIRKGENKKRAKQINAGLSVQDHSELLKRAKAEAMAVVNATDGDPITTYRAELQKRGFIYFGRCGHSYIHILYLAQRYSIWYDRLSESGKIDQATVEAYGLAKLGGTIEGDR